MRPPNTVPPVPEVAPVFHKPKSDDTLNGFLFAAGAFLIWGFLPLYLKLLEHIPTIEVIAHRIVWSVPVALLILVFLGRTADILPSLKNPKKLGILFICATVISVNWGLYVWAISVDRAVETALGYYINPLISVAMGALILGERLNRLQIMAVGLALAAVVYLTFVGGFFPWLSLVLAFSFATYGLLRKTVEVGPTQGFLIEVLLLSVLAWPYIGWLATMGEGSFAVNGYDTLLFFGCGPLTAIPLILYAFGAKGLRLSTIGMMQYIAPTMILLIGIFVFGEEFGTDRAIAFTLIWAALALYTWSMVNGQKKKAAA